MGLICRRSGRAPSVQDVLLAALVLAAAVALSADAFATENPGSVSILSSGAPGSSVSRDGAVLKGVARTAVSLGGLTAAYGNDRAATWRVHDLVDFLSSGVLQPLPATIIVSSADRGVPDLQLDVLIKSAAYNAAARELRLGYCCMECTQTFALKAEAISHLDVYMMGGRVLLDRPAQPTNPAYRPPWFDDNQQQSSQRVSAAAAVRPTLAPSSTKAIITTAPHSSKGATLTAISGTPSYRLTVRVPDQLNAQQLPSWTRDALSNNYFHADVASHKELVDRMTAALRNSPNLSSVVSARLASGKVLSAAVQVASVSLAKSGKQVVYRITPQPTQAKTLSLIAADLKKAAATAKAAAAADAAPDIGLRMFMATADNPHDACTTFNTPGCPPQYLGGAFKSLHAFPLPAPPEDASASTVTTVDLLSNMISARSPFTSDSLAAAKTQESVNQQCVSQAKVTSYQSASESRRSFAEDVKVSAKFFGVHASASESYASLSKTTSSSSSVLTKLEATCAVWSFSIPATLNGLALNPAFVQSVQNIIAAKYDATALYNFYETYGSHFVTTVALGGYTAMSMKSSAESLATYDSSDVSVGASMSYALIGSVQSSANWSNSENKTAQAQGWSWAAVQSPPTVELTWKEDSKNNPIPDATTYAQKLRDTSQISPFDLVPVGYTVAELSSVFNTGTLWSKSGVTATQARAFGTTYTNFVANCMSADTTPSSLLTCLYDNMVDANNGCGKLGYPDPQNTNACISCLDPNRVAAGFAACPVSAASCSLKSTAPRFTCNRRTNALWSFAQDQAPPQCLTHTVTSGDDDTRGPNACMYSPITSGRSTPRYRVCLTNRADVKIEDLDALTNKERDVWNGFYDRWYNEYDRTATDPGAAFRIPGFPHFCRNGGDDLKDKALYWQHPNCYIYWQNRNTKPIPFPAPLFDAGDTLELCLRQDGRLVATANTAMCIPWGLGDIQENPRCDGRTKLSARTKQVFWESFNYGTGNEGPYTAVMQENRDLVIYNKGGTLSMTNHRWHTATAV